MNPSERYMVFRVPTFKERNENKSIPYLWGWTTSKSVIRVFKKQRDQSKYKIIIMDSDDIAREFSENELSDDTRIDYVNLGDNTTGEMVPFFTTKVEMQEAEVRIQRLMDDLCSFEKQIGGDITPYVTIMVNLKEYYQDLLEYIGFCPREMRDLFTMGESYDSRMNELEDEIFDGYRMDDSEYDPHSPPGAKSLRNLNNKIIYSLQSFVSVLKDDL